MKPRLLHRGHEAASGGKSHTAGTLHPRIARPPCSCTIAAHEALVLDLEEAGEVELALRARAMFGLPVVEDRKAPWWVTT